VDVCESSKNPLYYENDLYYTHPSSPFEENVSLQWQLHMIELKKAYLGAIELLRTRRCRVVLHRSLCENSLGTRTMVHKINLN